MIIRREPILLCLTSTERVTDSFELSSRYSKYDVHVMPTQEKDIPNEIKLIDADTDENRLTFQWAEKLNRYRFHNKDEQMFNKIPYGSYRISADKPGAIVYMTPGNVVGFPDFAGAIHLMADAIVNLEARVNKLESFMSESKERFEQIESDISE